MYWCSVNDGRAFRPAGFDVLLSVIHKKLPLLASLFLSLMVSCPLARADSQNPPNTVARFQIQRGTNLLGSMDVELFDQDKPQTVSNFLLYVRSGAYSNMFLHRCLPGFVVQGGGFSVTNPMGTNAFSIYNEVTNYGRLTNEFLVGPLLSNTFGTIAMAKVGGDPNSATSQWFFNLGDNSGNLDNQNGGFTVFGRVLESTNVSEGTNILGHFNTLSTNAGIVNLGTNLSVFSDLPVAYTNSSRKPMNGDLYYVQISLLNRTNQPGQTPPTITLVSPPPNSSFTNGVVTVAGTASDDAEVARVVYRVQGGSLEIGAGTTNWLFSVFPQVGLNTVTVQSIDWDGNFSSNAPSVTFLYISKLPLNLKVLGSGTVSGATNGQFLQAGLYYTFTATPGAGYVFDSWTGTVSSASASLTFQVPTNATNVTLTARFIPDPLPQLAGTYYGLFRGTNAPQPENAGFMSLILQANGAFSGNLLHRGVTYNYTGHFDSNATAIVSGDVGGINRSVSLQLVRTNSAGLITGTFLGTPVEVQLERLASALPTSNGPPAGAYTFVLPGNPTPASQFVPGGDGFGTATLATSGALNLSGTLGDGTAFTAAPSLTRLGHWPLYVSLFAGRGVLLGWVSSPTNLPTNLEASLQWIKSPGPSDPTYQLGFSNQVAFLGSRYVQPANGVRALNWVYGLSVISGTDLQLTVTNLVKLSTTNSLNVVDANASLEKLSLDPRTGLLTGSFRHPWFGTSNVLRGVLLKRAESIRGQFLTGNQSGNLNISLAPFLVTQTVASVTLPALTSALSEGGLLRFDSDGTVTLTNSITLPYSTALDANGHAVVINGGGANRLFIVPTNLNLSAQGMVFADGRNIGANGANTTPPQPGGEACGAGILNLGGVVGLTNCTFTNCFVQGGSAGAPSSTNLAPGGRGFGAAICNRGGQITLQSCLFVNNAALGGQGRADTLATALSSQRGGAFGAALFSENGSCEVGNTKFIQNFTRGGSAQQLPSGDYSQAGDAAGGSIAIVNGRLHLVSSQCLSNTASGPGSITNCAGPGSGHGGALFVETNAQAAVEQTTFSQNRASGGDTDQATQPGIGRGGAIFNAGLLQLRDCTLDQNLAQGGSSSPSGPGLGGAVASIGTFRLNSSTLNDNRAIGGDGSETAANGAAGAEGAGGAIHLLGGSFAGTNATVAFNQAVGGSGAHLNPANLGLRGIGRGGALAAISNNPVLVSVTLALNQALAGLAGSTNSTVAFGGGIAGTNGLSLRSSLLVTNIPDNIFGSATDLGYNFSSDGSPNLSGTGSRTNIDPLLGPLNTNGGPTRTMALLAGSPARDAAPSFNPPFVDQRGISRPQGASNDIGAFEFVQTLPVLTVTPLETNVLAGQSVSFQTINTGAAALRYFWLKDGVLVPDANSSTFTIGNAQETNQGAYAAVATNSYGSVTSSVARLTVDSRPQLVGGPDDVTIRPSASTSFVFTVRGPAMTYLWFHNSSLISGATNATLNIVNASPGAQGTYQAIATNFAGSVTSRIATLTFNSLALTILDSPKSTNVAEGDSATFHVLPTGVEPISVQWYFDSVRLGNATNATLLLTNVSVSNEGNYAAIVSNGYLMVTSDAATLTVTKHPVLSINLGTTNLLITCTGRSNKVHRLLCATNLSQSNFGVPVATNALTNGTITWSRPFTTSAPAFYRAVSP